VSTAVDLRYPVGDLKFDPHFDAAKRAAAMRAIAELPEKMSAAVAGLNDAQLDTPYREGGWTVRQVVHHVVDSHMNAYVRCKLMVTETDPPLKAYNEKVWAELPDSKLPVSLSLSIIDGLHRRWSALLESLSPEDFARTGIHSERGPITIDTLMQIYGWHCRHHVAHITELRKRQGW
jgi:hypothetical protein